MQAQLLNNSRAVQRDRQRAAHSSALSETFWATRLGRQEFQQRNQYGGRGYLIAERAVSENSKELAARSYIARNRFGIYRPIREETHRSRSSDDESR